MAIYAIGDVQGCYNELIQLLDKINFNAQKDRLWFTGDLINRGSQSLEVLRFVKNLGKKAVTVLGNHDLHYLAVSAKAAAIQKHDTFQDILNAPDADKLFHWLRKKPLAYYHHAKKILLVHAGLCPVWDIPAALKLSREVENRLKSKNYKLFLANMYGNTPTVWSKNLKKYDRLRIITNYFTRMRYIDKMGGLAGSNEHNDNYQPWFSANLNISRKTRIIFGHWAALQGKTGRSNILGLDTGCVWGNCLTALRLSDLKYFNINCQHYYGRVEHDKSC